MAQLREVLLNVSVPALLEDLSHIKLKLNWMKYWNFDLALNISLIEARFRNIDAWERQRMKVNLREKLNSSNRYQYLIHNSL